LRSLTDLTEHLKARADDDRAAPVTWLLQAGTALFPVLSKDVKSW